MFSRCVVTVAAVRFPPIKERLQAGGLSVVFTCNVQVSCVIRASWNTFSNSWICLAVRVFFVSWRRHVFPDISAADVAPSADERALVMRSLRASPSTLTRTSHQIRQTALPRNLLHKAVFILSRARSPRVSTCLSALDLWRCRVPNSGPNDALAQS